MSTASTSKKIQRVQKAGVNRRAGQRRPIGFPLAMISIVVVGTVLVLLARDARQNVDAQAPIANRDHWHSAIGLYVCDQYLPTDNVADVAGDPLGIHSHGDGLMHIHPFSAAGAGKNATLGKFFDAEGIKADAKQWTHTPPGVPPSTHKSGDSCAVGKKKTKKTSVKLLIWPPQASEKTKPEVVTDDFASVKFAEDGQIFVLALLPNSMSVNDVPLPPSVSALANPSDATGAPPAPTDSAPTDSAPTDSAPTDSSAPVASTTTPAG